MTARLHALTASPAARTRALAAAAALGAGACLALAGCSASSGNTAAGTSAPHSAAMAGAAPEMAPAPVRAPGSPARLTALPAPGQAIIYTASMTVRAADVRAAAARAAQLAGTAGGYVSSETTLLNHAHPADSTVLIELKIPVGGYQDALGALSTRLGTRISLSQHAQDVTQTVADVTSRVTSAQAAITQLRKLLARAGSVSSLLMVQDQINSEESNLEALQSQQRALAHETTYATVTVQLVSKRPPPAARPVKLAGGFTGGLAAGWHALRQVTSWLLTGIGAALPFAAFVAIAVAGLLWGRRRLARRRAGAGPAQPAG